MRSGRAAALALCVAAHSFPAHAAPADNLAALWRALGACAKLDGVLRSHQINRHPEAQGALRDTCV